MARCNLLRSLVLAALVLSLQLATAQDKSTSSALEALLSFNLRASVSRSSTGLNSPERFLSPSRVEHTLTSLRLALSAPQIDDCVRSSAYFYLFHVTQLFDLGRALQLVSALPETFNLMGAEYESGIAPDVALSAFDSLVFALPTNERLHIASAFCGRYYDHHYQVALYDTSAGVVEVRQWYSREELTIRKHMLSSGVAVYLLDLDQSSFGGGTTSRRLVVLRLQGRQLRTVFNCEYIHSCPFNDGYTLARVHVDADTLRVSGYRWPSGQEMSHWNRGLPDSTFMEPFSEHHVFTGSEYKLQRALK